MIGDLHVLLQTVPDCNPVLVDEKDGMGQMRLKLVEINLYSMNITFFINIIS